MMHTILGEIGGFVLGNVCMYLGLRFSRTKKAAQALTTGTEAHWADVAAGLTYAELIERSK